MATASSMTSSWAFSTTWPAVASTSCQPWWESSCPISPNPATWTVTLSYSPSLAPRNASAADVVMSPAWTAATRRSPLARTASPTSWAVSAWAATCAASFVPQVPSASQSASPNARTNKTAHLFGRHHKKKTINTLLFSV